MEFVGNRIPVLNRSPNIRNRGDDVCITHVTVWVVVLIDDEDSSVVGIARVQGKEVLRVLGDENQSV